jgi:predicted O-methyltransferase YrrM
MLRTASVRDGRFILHDKDGIHIMDMKANYIRILDYLDANLDDDPVCNWILQETVARHIPQIQITAVQGRFLNLLATLLGARRILEVGTLSGYSGVWLARALPADGRLITLEVSAQHAALARESFRRAEVDGRVQLIVGPALDTLKTLTLDAPLDMAFIDADKPNNLNYFQWAYERLRPGGLVVIDNVLANGHVVEGDNGSAYSRSIAAFNRHIFEHYADEACVVPYFKKDEDNLDGNLIVRKPLA